MKRLASLALIALTSAAQAQTPDPNLATITGLNTAVLACRSSYLSAPCDVTAQHCGYTLPACYSVEQKWLAGGGGQPAHAPADPQALIEKAAQ